MPTLVRMASPWDYPQLPGYMTVAQVAKLWGTSKENIFYKIYNQQKFKHVYRVGENEDETKRPMLMLLAAEVREVYEREQREKQEGKPLTVAQQRAAWFGRVRVWGREQGWRSKTGSPVYDSGPLHRDLMDDYLKAHPDDAEPAYPSR